MSDVQEPQVLAFEGFYIDERQRLLFNGGRESLSLPSRAFDILLFLARHPHELIDKQRLMQAVWPKAVVEENNLSQHISLIRKVLGEAPNQHRFIVTVPGRGFRFVPNVQRLESLPWLAAPVPGSASSLTVEPAIEPAHASAVAIPGGRLDSIAPRRRASRGWSWAAAILLLALAGMSYRLVVRHASAPATPSIAVLAFADTSPARDQGYFPDGLAEELINQLTRIPGLRVIGRTSSFVFKGRNEDSRRIGEILGVSHILDGSVTRLGDRIRIRALLIHAADGTQVWSETYDRKLDDIFAIQDEISRTVAARLQLKLSGEDLSTGGTHDLAAYDEYLAGRALMNTAGEMIAAVPKFESAVMRDPGFTTARLWLIDAYLRMQLGRVEMQAQATRLQDAMIDEVVRRNRGKPEASFALSYRSGRGRDLPELERQLRDATRIKGSAGMRARLRYGQFLLAVGHSRAALQQLETVQRDDPLDDFGRTQVLIALEQAGLPGQAEQEIRQFLGTPGGNTAAIHGLAVSLAMGRNDRAALTAAIQSAVAAGQFGEDRTNWWNQMLGDRSDALQSLRRKAVASQLRGDIYFAASIAQDAAFLGDTQLALQALTAMLDSGFSMETVAWVLWRPVLRDVRKDPAFKAIVRDYGFERYWRATGDWGDSCAPTGPDDFECH